MAVWRLLARSVPRWQQAVNARAGACAGDGTLHQYAVFFWHIAWPGHRPGSQTHEPTDAAWPVPGRQAQRPPPSSSTSRDRATAVRRCGLLCFPTLVDHYAYVARHCALTVQLRRSLRRLILRSTLILTSGALFATSVRRITTRWPVPRWPSLVRCTCLKIRTRRGGRASLALR